MVASIVSRKFVELMVLSELNYREVQPEGVQMKINVLHRSTLNDNTDVRGWRDQYPVEIVDINNPAIYQIKKLKWLNIFNAEQLLAHYRSVLTLRLANAEKLKVPHVNELIGVIKAQIKAVDDGKVTHAILGGIHRGLAFDTVLAMWEYEKAHPVAGVDSPKFSDEVPAEIYTPTTFMDLINSAHRRNGEGMQQVFLTAVDYINLAFTCITVLGRNVTYFRNWASTGATTITSADLAADKKIADKKVSVDAGGKFTLYYNIAKIASLIPSLDIMRRIGINPETTDQQEKLDYIDVKRLIQASLAKGDPYRNINYFRACASEKLAVMYFEGGARTEDPVANSEPGKIKAGLLPYWETIPGRMEEWWNNHCPNRFPEGKMPVSEKKETTVNVGQVQTLAESSQNDLVKNIVGNLLMVGGADAPIGEFLGANEIRLNVANLFFSLARDPVTAGTLLTIGTSLEAVRDMDGESFRGLIGDVVSLVKASIERLKPIETTTVEPTKNLTGPVAKEANTEADEAEAEAEAKPTGAKPKPKTKAAQAKGGKSGR